MSVYVIGLGSSLGPRRQTLELALRLLDLGGARVQACSRVHLSPPSGGVARNPFLNAAVRVDWSGTASALLKLLKSIEQRAGRRDAPRWADRVLDLDLLWSARGAHREPGLVLPHPRLAERSFALDPLLEVAPEACDEAGRPYAGRQPLPGCAAVGVLAHAPPSGSLARPQQRQYSQRHSGAPAMKFFLDTANLDEIRQAKAWGIVDGVTTNPSLIAKEGGDFIATIAEICTIVDGPISAEVVTEDAVEMVRQGKLLARIHDNVVVKVPLTEQGIIATSQLSAAGIKTNVTLCFQPVQALVAAKAGATYVSPFVGRIDDVGRDGMQMIEQIVDIYANYPDLETQVLAASIRHPQHVLQAALAGSHVATIPFGVMRKLFAHPLTDTGNAAFTAAWDSVPDKDIVGQVTRWLQDNGR